MNQYGDFGKETEELMTICERNDRIPPELFKEFGVKRGLRDVDGTGVLAGISNISRIDFFGAANIGPDLSFVVTLAFMVLFLSLNIIFAGRLAKLERKTMIKPKKKKN